MKKPKEPWANWSNTLHELNGIDLDKADPDTRHFFVQQYNAGATPGEAYEDFNPARSGGGGLSKRDAELIKGALGLIFFAYLVWGCCGGGWGIFKP